MKFRRYLSPSFVLSLVALFVALFALCILSMLCGCSVAVVTKDAAFEARVLTPPAWTGAKVGETQTTGTTSYTQAESTRQVTAGAVEGFLRYWSGK